MKKNESGLDRLLRVLVGLMLLSLVFVGPHTAWGWVGIVPLLTGIVGFCPLYRLAGIDTCHLRLTHRGA
jgi:hypothetical protein